MATYAKIDNGVVVNVVEADSTFAAAHGLVLLVEPATIGWLWDGAVFTPPTPQPEVVRGTDRVSAYQLRVGAKNMGISQTIRTYISGLDEDTKDEWRFKATWRRDDPRIEDMRVALGRTEAQIDSLWLEAKHVAED